MFLNIIFLFDCWICTWWLLPLLVGAWFLGWLFWRLTGRQKYVTQIDQLQGQNRQLNVRLTDLNKDLATSQYEFDKLTEDYDILRSKNADLDIRLRACDEKNSRLEAAAFTGTAVTPPIVNKLVAEPVVEDVASPEPESIIEDIEAEPVVEEIDDADVVLETPVEENIEQSGIALTPISEIEPEPVVDEVAPPEVQQLVSDAPKPMGMGTVFAEDNLQIIEGVGPKIEGLLKAAGFTTWAKVADASKADLQKVLEDAGPRYRVHKPDSWPEQARFAVNDDWPALVNYQKFLDTGRSETNKETPSKVEKLYAKKIGFASVKQNDLKIVEGIGPKIAGLLQAGGIDTWAKLAGAEVTTIQGILTAAGDRYRLADPTTWPKQAALAAKAQWGELKAYQDSLKGGKE